MTRQDDYDESVRAQRRAADDPVIMENLRRRLTKDEWEAELARAKGVQAADVERSQDLNPYRTRTGRRRSWWQRGWKR